MPNNASSLMTNLLKDAAKVESIDYSAEFDNLYTRMDNLWKLFNDEQMSTDLIRYIYQDQLKLHIRGKLNQQRVKKKC